MDALNRLTEGQRQILRVMRRQDRLNAPQLLTAPDIAIVCGAGLSSWAAPKLRRLEHLGLVARCELGRRAWKLTELGRKHAENF